MSEKKKNNPLLTIGKLSITTLVFWWVLHKLGPEGRHQLVVNVQSADLLGIFKGLICLIVLFSLGVARWQLLLRVQGIHISNYRATWITSVGVFFNVFLIGAVGGDVPKAWYVSKAAPDRKPEAILTIALDRIIGLLGLFLLASIVVLLDFNFLVSEEKTRPCAYFVIVSLFSAVVALALTTQRHWIASQSWWKKIWERLPGKEILSKLSESYDVYGKNPKTLVLTLLISMSIHTCSILAAYFIGSALHIEGVSLRHYFVYVPIINTITALPISIGGVGLREKAFTWFFAIHGVPDHQSTALSLLFYGAQLALSLGCGLFYLIGKPKSEVIVPLEAVNE
jgi:uncharacterized protein (TIRG00374 family)